MAVLRLSPLKMPGRGVLAASAALALVAGGAVLYAQIEGERGIPPVASSGDFEVSGIEVNTTGRSAEDARNAGWREAERKAWAKLWSTNGVGGADGGAAPSLDDGTIGAMVAAVVVEHEQIGPHRYIARLGVVFDRARAGGYLGLKGATAHSAPMLVIPVLTEGGVTSVFETRTPWQKAWADFHIGESVIDYVRPSGTGADSLLLTAGQVSRRSRNWWRVVLDQFGAEDVLIPMAHLERQWPGGPIKGSFVARYGPDNRYLGEFELTAANDEQLPAMLSDAVHRIDALYAAALVAGRLNPDPSLASQPQIDPKLIDAVVTKLGPPRGVAADAVAPTAAGPASPAGNLFQIQFVTPDAAAVDAALAAVRAVPGVQAAATSSLALGGTSVMRVNYGGEIEALAAALRAGGWKVTQGAGALTIRR